MTLLSRLKDTTTATSTTVSHRLERGMYLFRAASTKFKIQVRIIVESSNTVRKPKAHVTDNKRSIVLLEAVLLKYEDTVTV